MTRLCDAWPLSTATNVYFPGLNVFWESAMWNSVSVAFTVVSPADPAGADEDGAAGDVAGAAADDVAGEADEAADEQPTARKTAVAPVAVAASARPRRPPRSRRVGCSLAHGSTNAPHSWGWLSRGSRYRRWAAISTDTALLPRRRAADGSTAVPAGQVVAGPSQGEGPERGD